MRESVANLAGTDAEFLARVARWGSLRFDKHTQIQLRRRLTVGFCDLHRRLRDTVGFAQFKQRQLNTVSSWLYSRAPKKPSARKLARSGSFSAVPLPIGANATGNHLFQAEIESENSLPKPWIKSLLQSQIQVSTSSISFICVVLRIQSFCESWLAL